MISKAEVDQLAGGELPPEFDGVDLMPLLSQKASKLVRQHDLFWDWGDGIALQRDGWKIRRFGKSYAMFDIQNGARTRWGNVDRLQSTETQLADLTI